MTTTNTHRGRALLALALAATCLLGALAIPANAATPRWRRVTTTTAKATTTTVKPTTTTVKPTTTTVAPTTTTTVASGPNCGATLAKATGGTWQCTFADEFNGSTLNANNWMVQTTAASGFRNGPECFVNTPNNVAVANGVLSLTARKEAAPFTCASSAGSYSSQYTSGMVMSYGKFSQAFGRFEVRAKFPTSTVKGLQESLWLWPDNPFKYGYTWPQSGEIDIAEVYSQYADRAIPYIHYVPAAPDYNVTNNYCMISNLGAFHDYAVEWTATTITIIYDGKTCVVDTWNPYGLTKPAPFDSPFMIALTQALGIGTNAFDPATTQLPATTQIDYVHVWK